jgi:hypothetical protein
MPQRKSADMRKTKFDTYFEICQRVVAALSDTESKQLSEFIGSFSESVDQISAWVAEKTFPTPKSEIAKGLEQGINELPLLLEDLEPHHRSKALAAYWGAVNSVVPDYSAKFYAKIQSILKLGSIKTESEFYLLRNRLDQIEGSSSEEESAINELLGQYEAKA